MSTMKTLLGFIVALIFLAPMFFLAREASESSQDQEVPANDGLDSVVGNRGEEVKEPPLAPSARTHRRSELDLQQEPEESGRDDDPPDASGLTSKGRLRGLLVARQQFLRRDELPEIVRPRMELSLAAKSVVNILRENGRADYGNPLELEIKGGFSSEPDWPDEWVFFADQARYDFKKGEFPAYDIAMERLDVVQKGGELSPLSIEQCLEFEAIYELALGALGVPIDTEPDPQQRKENGE